MTSKTQQIEASLGFFDVALSFAADGETIAHDFTKFVKFHDLKCYYYARHLLMQSGLQIESVMRFVYLHTNMVVVLNTPEYGKSRSTRLEIDILETAVPGKQICIVELGGGPLQFRSHNVLRYPNLSSDVALSIIEISRRDFVRITVPGTKNH